MKRFIWLVLIVIVIYYGYQHFFQNDTGELESETATNQETTTASSAWLTYNSQTAANYSIQYPSDWEITTNEQQTVFTSADGLDKVNIKLQASGQATASGSQTIKEISGQQVLVIEGTDPSDGSPTKFIYFNLNSNQKLVVEGFGSIFEKMLGTLVISSQQPNLDSIVSEETESPSDEDENDDANEIVPAEETSPVAETPTATITPEEDQTDAASQVAEDETAPEEFIIKLFYPKNNETNCSQVYGLVKAIDTRYNTDEVNALVSLVKALDADTIAAGYFTAIPDGTRLRQLTITNGVATADFNSVLNSGGGSCAMAARRAQIEQTLLQFPDIEQVVITVDGDAATALQP
jgi:spore germination protein GerM